MVVGSINVDLVVSVPRLPAPGQTVIGGEHWRAPGGKGGNQAAAAARLGAGVALVASVGEVLASGKARAWGIVNWPASLIAEAVEAAARSGVAGPCAAQLPYSLVRRSPVEDEEMVEVLRGANIPVVASAVLAGGALTGKYATAEATGRVASQREDPRLGRAFEAGKRLRALAERGGTTPAALAIAFTLANPDVASVLFGATSPAQVRENVSATELAASMDDALLAELRQIG